MTDKLDAHFDLLFELFRDRFGAFADATLSAIVGFDAGGPVSMFRVAGTSVFATCELSLYPEQILSSEGLRFELFSTGFEESDARAVLTAIGDLSMGAELGDGHTVDVSSALEAERARSVALRLFSRRRIGDADYGVYEVVDLG